MVTKETSLRSIFTLRANSKIAYVASVDGGGLPLVRSMLVLEHDGFKTQYFSTNTSSKKVAEFRGNKKASVYYCDEKSFNGVLFCGDMEVCTDQPTKDFLWREGFECYYPLGVTDPAYCVLKFTESGWALISDPSKEYLSSANNKNALLGAIEQAKLECGSCGCEYDPLYSRALALKDYL